MMSVKRNNSKQMRDFPGYSGNFKPVYEANWEPPIDYQDSVDFNKWQRAHSTTATSDQYDSEKQPKTIWRVFTRFAERTSMQGVPYINTSKTWYAKLLWTVVLLGALAVMTLHFYFLITTFIAFTKKTQVELGFQNLKFPSVTFCNINPVRDSKLSLGSPELRKFVNQIRPAKIVSSLKSQAPTPAPAPDPAPGRKRRFVEDVELNLTNTRRENERPPRPGKFTGRKSNLLAMKEEFTYLFSLLNRATRVKMGHELSDMLVSCSFSGIDCNASFFRILPTSEFGNCFTLEHSQFVSYKNGPKDGLELILFLEKDEYLQTIASGSGAQVNIHATNTWPSPATDGMAVSAAMETNIAMRMVNIERTGMPYGVCETGLQFKAKYGMQYTRQTCQTFCVQDAMMERCGCYDETKQELHYAMRSQNSSMPPCRGQKEVECMLELEEDWEMGQITCQCDSPCSETIFQRIVHSRSWPSSGYAAILVQHLCNVKNDTECERFEKMDHHQLSQNFMKINIYFEDLNYENITESGDYEPVQFLSDIGGTLGLWIGLSILSVAEVIQFFSELIHYLVVVRPRQRRKDRKRKQQADNTNTWEVASSETKQTPAFNGYSPHLRNESLN